MTLAISWSSIPAVVPVHIGFDGKIDRWGSKWELIIVAVIIAVLFISIVTALRLSFLSNNKKKLYMSVKKGGAKEYSPHICLLSLWKSLSMCY